MPSHVVILNDLIVARGGATYLALKLSRLLVEAGVRVTYFTGADVDTHCGVDSDLEIVSVGGSHIMNRSRISAFTNGLYFAPARSKLAAWIAEHDSPDVIYHVHGWSKVLSPSIFGALRTVAGRTILHAHDFFLACPNGGFTNYRSGEICHLAPASARCVMLNCDKRSYPQKVWRLARHGIRGMLYDFDELHSEIILIHDKMRSFFRRSGIPDERLHVIRNPIDVVSTERVHAERNQVAYFIGRLDEEKGVEDAAAAARAAGIELRIIGDGPLRSRIATAFPEIKLEGWRSTEQIAVLLQAARFVVIPSRFVETFGLVAFEALSRGIPIVISEKALIAGEVERFGCGVKVNTRDVKQFADIMRHLSIADRVIEDLSRHSMNAARELSLTPAKWRDSLLALYSAVLDRANGCRPRAQ
jgi:glycosyltransferase involved in cell wall biosynthesis